MKINTATAAWRALILGTLATGALVASLYLTGCDSSSQEEQVSQDEIGQLKVNDVSAEEESSAEQETGAEDEQTSDAAAEEKQAAQAQSAEALRAALTITEDYRSSFNHGEKGAAYQKYIVLHDTESESSAASVVDYWDSNGNLIAAHFVINKDGSIVQCVPLDSIAHHAGWGDTGHNELYGVTEDGRDDLLGQKDAPSWAQDYGMNSYSIGIEMVHVGGSGGYPEAQLEALDGLIAYIDAYYGTESQIIDHKMWRSGNSDTSDAFATYLANYQDHRTHT